MASKLATLVEALRRDLKAVEERLERLEQDKQRRIGFAFEGEVGGHIVEQSPDEPYFGDRKRRG